MSTHLILAFLSACFDRHGFLFAREIAGAHGDQVLCPRLQVSQYRRVLPVINREHMEFPCRKGGVLHLVSLYRIRLQRPPAQSHTGRGRLRHRHLRWALDLCVRGYEGKREDVEREGIWNVNNFCTVTIYRCM